MIVGGLVGSAAGAVRDRLAGIVIVFCDVAVNSSSSAAA